jgi:DNA adenine methylase
VIQKNDTEQTLFYVDPPYLHSLRSAVSTKAYRHEMTDAQHEELATLLHSVKGKVVVSGYPSDLRTEVLWMNF